MIETETISQEMGTEDRLLTAKDIARIFSTGKNRAYELMNSSGFPTLKVGNRLYVARKALDRWIDLYTGSAYLV